MDLEVTATVSFSVKAGFSGGPTGAEGGAATGAAPTYAAGETRTCSSFPAQSFHAPGCGIS